MENNNKTALAIYNQICQVNDLDPQAIREEAKQGEQGKQLEGEQVASLIRAAFRHRANALVAELDLASNRGGLVEGKEYSADGDPAAPSFTIHEDNIRAKYSADEAEKVIEALGQVQLPIQA